MNAIVVLVATAAAAALRSRIHVFAVEKRDNPTH
jgi:hypothetical protein